MADRAYLLEEDWITGQPDINLHDEPSSDYVIGQEVPERGVDFILEKGGQIRTVFGRLYERREGVLYTKGSAHSNTWTQSIYNSAVCMGWQYTITRVPTLDT